MALEYTLAMEEMESRLKQLDVSLEHGVRKVKDVYAKLVILQNEVRQRLSDFPPVGEELEDEVLERGYSSVSSDDSDGCGLEYAFDDEDAEYHEGLDDTPDQGNLRIDF